MGRLSYLRRTLAAQFTAARFQCPSCGSSKSELVDRKYVVTQLRRCEHCRLLYRTPTDDPGANAAFYENEYRQGLPANVPSDMALAELKRSNFSGTQLDHASYIGALNQLGVPPGGRIFDFGCSWGYGSYQLSQAGFAVTAFDVATGRRNAAKDKLGVQVVEDMEAAAREMAGQFDCFFASHVIEHVPSPAQSFDYAMRLLKPGGLFVSFTPNGSAAFRATSAGWSELWGEVHPNFIDDEFLDRSFRRSPRVIGSLPVTAAHIPDDTTMLRLDPLAGWELFFAARKSAATWA